MTELELYKAFHRAVCQNMKDTMMHIDVLAAHLKIEEYNESNPSKI